MLFNIMHVKHVYLMGV